MLLKETVVFLTHKRVKGLKHIDGPKIKKKKLKTAILLRTSICQLYNM